MERQIEDNRVSLFNKAYKTFDMHASVFVLNGRPQESREWDNQFGI